MSPKQDTSTITPQMYRAKIRKLQLAAKHVKGQHLLLAYQMVSHLADKPGQLDVSTFRRLFENIAGPAPVPPKVEGAVKSGLPAILPPDTPPKVGTATAMP